MKLRKVEKSQNKIGLKGCKWSSLNAPGTKKPLSLIHIWRTSSHGRVRVVPSRRLFVSPLRRESRRDGDSHCQSPFDCIFREQGTNFVNSREPHYTYFSIFVVCRCSRFTSYIFWINNTHFTFDHPCTCWFGATEPFPIQVSKVSIYSKGRPESCNTNTRQLKQTEKCWTNKGRRVSFQLRYFQTCIPLC